MRLSCTLGPGMTSALDALTIRCVPLAIMAPSATLASVVAFQAEGFRIGTADWNPAHWRSLTYQRALAVRFVCHPFAAIDRLIARPPSMVSALGGSCFST